jgi:hypothetical protein
LNSAIAFELVSLEKFDESASYFTTSESVPTDPQLTAADHAHHLLALGLYYRHHKDYANAASCFGRSVKEMHFEDGNGDANVVLSLLALPTLAKHGLPSDAPLHDVSDFHTELEVLLNKLADRGNFGQCLALVQALERRTDLSSKSKQAQWQRSKFLKMQLKKYAAESSQ